VAGDVHAGGLWRGDWRLRRGMLSGGGVSDAPVNGKQIIDEPASNKLVKQRASK